MRAINDRCPDTLVVPRSDASPVREIFSIHALAKASKVSTVNSKNKCSKRLV